MRPCRPSDADAVYSAVRESITEVSKWAPWCPPDYSMSHCKPWLDFRPRAWSEGKEFDFVILDASQRVAEKAGATREGIERNRHVVREKVYDVIMFSLIPDDLKE